MHHLLHHHVVTHVVIPILVSTAIGMAIGATGADSRGQHPNPGKLPNRTVTK